MKHEKRDLTTELLKLKEQMAVVENLLEMEKTEKGKM